ncbi:MAG: F0F1 ATP synthase subunit delta [Actinomycetes bacterium]
MIVLGGSSRQALLALRGALDEQLKGASSAECTALSADLFKALGAVGSSVGLRRALTDPARDHASKTALINDLFGSQIGAKAVSLLVSAASFRWSSSSEIADAIEQIAVEAEATAANGENALDRVEEELFLFSRLIVTSNELRLALNDRADSTDRKVALVDSIFAAKAAPSTVRLLEALVGGTRGRSIEAALSAFAHAVSARRNRLVAVVRSVIALTPAQAEKLAASLTKQVGQPVHINTEIDPSVLGGIEVRFADEIIDGTISNRLAEASRALAV